MRFNAVASLSLLLCLTTAAHSTHHHNSPRNNHPSRREGLFRDIGVALSSLVTPRTKSPPLEARKVVKRGSAVNANNQCVLKAPGNALTPGTSGHSSSTQSHSQATPTSPNGFTSSSSTHKGSSTSTGTAASPTSSWTKKFDASGSDFFDSWTFFTGGDPTHGAVLFQGESDAKANNLTAIDSNGNAVMRVETTPQVASTRMSVRIESSTTFTGGLWILDALHMPAGCGTWPAFWTHGPDWPQNGEIDILEGVNGNTHNQASLHTRGGCQLTPNSGYTGTLVDGVVCDSSGDNTGCGLVDPNPNSYGATFNQNNGGVYAMLWDDDGISIWFFPRNSIPSDITSQAPNPSSWGTPSGNWAATSCPPFTYNQQHTTIFDTTLCGDWAGGAWAAAPNGGGPSCQQSTGAATCEAYVLANGGAFSEAYWKVKSVRIYQTS